VRLFEHLAVDVGEAAKRVGVGVLGSQPVAMNVTVALRTWPGVERRPAASGSSDPADAAGYESVHNFFHNSSRI
jgi:hypothetical protein